MLQTVLSRTLWFIGLILLQVLVFNHVHIFGYATPMPYVYFLLILPVNTPRWLYIVLGFFLGLIIDVCSCTPGIAAGSLTMCGLAVPFLLKLFAPKDYDDTTALLPGKRTMEWGPFMRFCALAVVLHCTLFFVLEAFTFFNAADLLLNILGSSLLTLFVVWAIELIRNEK